MNSNEMKLMEIICNTEAKTRDQQENACFAGSTT